MYWRDHAPAHLHAFYQGFEGIFDLRSHDLIGGGMPKAARRMVKQWIRLHEQELLANWERGRLNMPFLRIPGADSE
jgi:hypothetical protein